MKTIVVTGASGLVARFLILELVKNKEYNVIAVSRNKNKIESLFKNNNVKCINYNELSNYVAGCVLIHCAFTRNNDGKLVTESLDLTSNIFMMALKYTAEAIINISSRSVYIEPNEGCLNIEISPLNYGSFYSVGKIVAENMLQNICAGTNIKFTNLRIASVNELKLDNTMVRPLNVFVKNVIEGKPIKIVGGNQMMSYIDPRDVATSIVNLLQISQWSPIYNIGTGWYCTRKLIDLANLVVDIGAQLGYDKVPIVVENKEINQRAGLDISKITADTGWIPQIPLEMMIKDLYIMLQ